MPSKRVGLALTTTCVLVLLSSTASAYCLTTLQGDSCTTHDTPLRWARNCVSYSLQSDATPGLPLATIEQITERAFSSWLAPQCGGHKPSISVSRLGSVTCSAVEFSPCQGNANAILFRSSSWPHADQASALGLTTVTYNTETAEIYDVDIEINTASVQITTGNDKVRYDLESILTHEFGHYFGLAHSKDTTASMFYKYAAGTVEMRTPAADDYAGICASYPPSLTPGTCDPAPYNGFSSTCSTECVQESGCTCTAGPSRSQSGALLAWIAACLAALVHLRRARSHRDCPSSDKINLPHHE